MTNLIIYAVILEGANIEVRPDKSERNAVCQVRRLNTVAPTTGFDRELYKRVFLTRRGMRSHTNEVQQIERCTDGCSQETWRYVPYTVEG